MNTNKQILDNAPDGATHIDNNGFYLRASTSGYKDLDEDNRDWNYDFANHCHTRSLADIKRIAELEKDKEFLLSKRFMGNTIFTNQGLNDAIAEHNLIQQAKGIEDALGDYDVNLELLAGDKFYKKALTNRVRKLREQAKGGAS